MRPISIERLEAELLSLYEPPLRAVATLREMRQVFGEIKLLPGVAKTSHLRPPAIAAWIKRYPARSPARVESLLRCWRVIVNYAVNEGYMRSSPFKTRKLSSWIRADAVKAKPKRLHRTAGEIRALLRLLDQEAGADWRTRRLQALFYVYVYTGFRKGEALHVLACNVDLDRKTITVEPLPGRGWLPKTVKSARTLPMAEPLVEVLRAWVPMCGSEWLFPGTRLVGPWTGGTGRYTALEQVKAAARRAGITDGMTILGGRKSAGTNAKAMGLGPIERMLLFGHTDEKTGELYDEEAVETMRPAVLKLQQFYASST